MKALRPLLRVSTNCFATALPSMSQTCLAASNASIRFALLSCAMMVSGNDFVPLVLKLGMYRKIALKNSTHQLGRIRTSLSLRLGSQSVSGTRTKTDEGGQGSRSILQPAFARWRIDFVTFRRSLRTLTSRASWKMAGRPKPSRWPLAYPSPTSRSSRSRYLSAG